MEVAEDLSLEVAVAHRQRAVAAAVVRLKVVEEAEEYPCLVLSQHDVLRKICCCWRNGCLEHVKARASAGYELGPVTSLHLEQELGVSKVLSMSSEIMY